MKIDNSLNNLLAKIVDTWLSYQIAYSEIPGLQITIRKADQLVLNSAYGFANIKKKEGYTSNHLGHFASHSKLFTACLLLRLQELGLLNLKDKIVEYLAQFRSHSDKNFKKITIEHLLSHRSGIIRDSDDSSYWELQRPFLNKKQIEEQILKSKLVYVPGEVSKYSNIGYSLLGMIIESASGESYESLFKKQILSKISNPKIFCDYLNHSKYKYADGYTRKIYNGKRKILKHFSANDMLAATGFCSNTENISMFFSKFLFTKTFLNKNSYKYLKSQKFHKIKNCKNRFYGIGMQYDLIDGQFFRGHSGGYPGFTSLTLNPVSSDYIFSLIANTNEMITREVVMSIVYIINYILKFFPKNEIKNIHVSDPIINKWGSSIWIASRNRAVKMPIDSWNISKDVLFAKKAKDDFYYSEKMVGYESIGEPISLFYKKNKIVADKIGGYSSYIEKAYLNI